MAQRHTEWKTLLGLLVMVAVGVGVAFLSWDVGKRIWMVFARYSMWDRIILEASRRNNVDPRLVKAVIWRESRFRADACGLKGEIGLMQLMPEASVADWARINGVSLPCKGILFTPELNIEIGSWYLGRAVRNWSASSEPFELALCEYNAGGSKARAWKPLSSDESVRDKINISSTLAYVNSVMAKYNEYIKEWRPADAAPQSTEGKKRK